MLDDLLQQHRKQETLKRVQKQRTEGLAKEPNKVKQTILKIKADPFVRAKSKSASKPLDTKFKRYVQPGVDTKFGRGLIHVPSPVMPYNDINNDHFMNKYPNQ